MEKYKKMGEAVLLGKNFVFYLAELLMLIISPLFLSKKENV